MNERNDINREINRIELAEQLVSKYGYTKRSALDLIDDFVGIVLDNMEYGNRVSIYGFGNFEVYRRAASNRRDFKTAERVEVPSHFVSKFTPGTRMKRAARLYEDSKKLQGDC